MKGEPKSSLCHEPQVHASLELEKTQRHSIVEPVATISNVCFQSYLHHREAHHTYCDSHKFCHYTQHGLQVKSNQNYNPEKRCLVLTCKALYSGLPLSRVPIHLYGVMKPSAFVSYYDTDLWLASRNNKSMRSTCLHYCVLTCGCLPLELEVSEPITRFQYRN